MKPPSVRTRLTILLAVGSLAIAAALWFSWSAPRLLAPPGPPVAPSSAEPDAALAYAAANFPKPADLPPAEPGKPIAVEEGVRAVRCGVNSAKYLFDSAVGDVRLVSTVENRGPGDLEELVVNMCCPENLDQQDIIELEFMPPAQRRVPDNRGQRIAQYVFHGVAPGQVIETGWRARVRTWAVFYVIDPGDVGALSEVPGDIATEYLQDDEVLRWRHPAVTAARNAALEGETNPLLVAQRLFNWLRGHLTYSIGGGWDDVVTVLERGSGSCSEYAFTFIALCRSAGIPARWVGALVRTGSVKCIGPYRDNSHHRWAEVYLPRIGWVHCDVSAGVWGYLPNTYLIVSTSSGRSDLMDLDYDVRCAWRFHGEPGKVRTERYALWNAHKDSFYIMTVQDSAAPRDPAAGLRVHWEVLGGEETQGKTLTLSLTREGKTLASFSGLDPAQGHVDLPAEVLADHGPGCRLELFRSDNPRVAGHYQAARGVSGPATTRRSYGWPGPWSRATPGPVPPR